MLYMLFLKGMVIIRKMEKTNVTPRALDNLVAKRDDMFKRGLAMQREKFKYAKTLSDYGVMRDCLENIKMEIKNQAFQIEEQDNIKKVEKIIEWYDMLPVIYSRRGPEGTYIEYPSNLNMLINRRFTNAYEILIGIMRGLDLL